MAYKRMCLLERSSIYKLLHKGLSQKEIACQLRRSPSSICDELHRFKKVICYCPYEAQKDADNKGLLRRKSPLLQKDLFLKNHVEKKLLSRWSPDQISLYFKKRNIGTISHETIYKYIYSMQDKDKRSELILCLRHKKKKRRRKNPHKKRSTIKNAIPIHKRAQEASTRQSPGHWEGDLVIGVNHGSAIATLVERSSRYTIVCPLKEGKQSKQVCLNVAASLGYLPRELKKSLTWDRGVEMAKHKLITDLLGMPVYFADPYSAWQRGSNENTNGLLRDYFPKSTDFNQINWLELIKTTEELNNRPRKTLNYYTPKEVFEWLISHPNRKLNYFINN